MQSLNKLIELQTPRQMSLNSNCIQLHFRDHAEQNRTNFYFKIALGQLVGGIICEKSRNIRILAWQESKKISLLWTYMYLDKRDSRHATTVGPIHPPTVLSQLRYL